MANFAQVNKTLRAQFPTLDFEVVRGEGYVYFDGELLDQVPSIYVHPVSTSTEDVVRHCRESIELYLTQTSKP